MPTTKESAKGSLLKLPGRKTKPSRQVISTDEVARRKAQSKRDKAKFRQGGNVFNSETILMVSNHEEGSKANSLVNIPIKDLTNVFSFIEGMRESLDDGAKRSVVDVKKLSIEAVNTSGERPVIGVVKVGSDERRFLLSPGGKSVVNFSPFSTLNGETEIDLVGTHGKAEIWFVIKCKVSVRFIY